MAADSARRCAAVAALAVAAGAAAAVVVVAAAVAAAGRTAALGSTTMKNTRRFVPAFLLLAAISSGGVEAAQRKFRTAQEGVNALVAAVRDNNKSTLIAILGADGRDIVSSGDEAQDASRRANFVAAYDAHSKLDQINAHKVMLDVGNDNWQFPIPLVKTASSWHFDTAAGKQELLARRIGQNELSAIQASLAYVDAQREYASEDRGDGVLDYAQRFRSSPNKHDGLYWETAGNEPQSPLGPAFAKARAEGYFGGEGPTRTLGLRLITATISRS